MWPISRQINHFHWSDWSPGSQSLATGKIANVKAWDCKKGLTLRDSYLAISILINKKQNHVPIKLLLNWPQSNWKVESRWKKKKKFQIRTTGDNFPLKSMKNSVLFNGLVLQKFKLKSIIFAGIFKDSHYRNSPESDWFRICIRWLSLNPDRLPQKMQSSIRIRIAPASLMPSNQHSGICSSAEHTHLWVVQQL